jgi:hypothetical protein
VQSVAAVDDHVFGAPGASGGPISQRTRAAALDRIRADLASEGPR